MVWPFKSRKNMAGLAHVALTYPPITATRAEVPAIAAEAIAKALAIPAPAEPFSVAKHHHTISNVLKSLETQAALLKREADDEARLHITKGRTEDERHAKAVKDEADRHSGVIETLVRKTTEVEQLQAFYSTGFDKLAAMVGDRVIGEPVKAVSFEECSASGAGHSFGSRGPDGALQCDYCGKAADLPPHAEPPAPAGDFKPSDVAIPKRTARPRNRKPTPDVVRNKGEDVKPAIPPAATDEQLAAIPERQPE